MVGPTMTFFFQQLTASPLQLFDFAATFEVLHLTAIEI
jgi:hypothetical protein